MLKDVALAAFNIVSTLVMAVTALTLTLLATLYPNYRASRVQPAEALRVEITFCQGLSKTCQ